ncbi:hypothetical protein BDR03DRAFT_932373 [Suillus americanus]|nr:hypothetical protein BDR03DRAFT_932373 [Suillus americanus]
MFPMLFLFGIGGFDDSTCTHGLMFQPQAEYYFNIKDRSFHHHWSYMFHHLAHLHTHFTTLNTVTAEQLCRAADQLQKEHSYSKLSPEDCGALNLLNQVNTIAACIPGSQASKMHIQSEIQSYFGFFGMPHFPIFQLIFGDETVDLTQHYPVLVSACECALRLTQDLVAAADFFSSL